MIEFSNPQTRREMNIPATFEISYHYLSEKIFLNKISTCFLKQMDVKWMEIDLLHMKKQLLDRMIHDSGFHKKTQITLNFTEVLTR